MLIHVYVRVADSVLLLIELLPTQLVQGANINLHMYKHMYIHMYIVQETCMYLLVSSTSYMYI